MPVMVNTKCLYVKRRTNDAFSNNKYFSFLALFCLCLLGDVFHCCCGKQGWKRSVLGRMRAVNWLFSLGEGCYGKRAIVMKAVVGKHCSVTVTLSYRFKRCWCKPSRILPCQQAVVRAKEHSRLLACAETQQAEGNGGHCFQCSLLLPLCMLHFLGPWGSWVVILRWQVWLGPNLT